MKRTNTATQALNSGLNRIDTGGGIVSELPVGKTFITRETAGRTISVWDEINKREQLIYGDTGRRNIAGDFDPGSSGGSVEISRTGPDVELVIYGLIFAGTAEPYTLPPGFRPPRSLVINNPFYGSNLTDERITLSALGGVLIFQVEAGATVYGVLRWKTDNPWPTTLPGTTVGTIPHQ